MLHIAGLIGRVETCDRPDILRIRSICKARDNEHVPRVPRRTRVQHDESILADAPDYEHPCSLSRCDDRLAPVLAVHQPPCSVELDRFPGDDPSVTLDVSHVAVDSTLANVAVVVDVQREPAHRELWRHEHVLGCFAAWTVSNGRCFVLHGLPLSGRSIVCLRRRDTVVTKKFSGRTIAGSCCPDVARASQSNKKPPENRGFRGARYWDRTSDLFRVREARYRCANRARWGYSVFP